MPLRTRTTLPQRWVHLLRDNAGHSTVEYALLLSLIVGSLAIALGSLAPTTRSLARLSHPDAMFGDSSNQRLNRPDKVPPEVSTANPPETTRPVPWEVLALSATCMAYAGYTLVRSRKKTEKPEVEETAEEVSSNPLFIKRQNILRIISADMQVLLESRLEARHLMSKRLTTVAPKESKRAIVETMTSQKLRHLMVCEQDRLVGIISDRDLHKPGAKTAADLMTRNPFCVEPDSPVIPAITQLMAKRISCLPVTQDGILVGVLTTTDLMMALQCTLQLLGKLSVELRIQRDPTWGPPSDEIDRKPPPDQAPRPCPVGADPIEGSESNALTLVDG